MTCAVSRLITKRHRQVRFLVANWLKQKNQCSTSTDTPPITPPASASPTTDPTGLTKNSSTTTTTVNNKRRIIFSGIQPTGVLHLGNYFGAVENWVELQNEGLFEKMYISIVDLHAITIPNRERNGSEDLSMNIRQMLACLLACGLDPEKVVLFQQSSVPQHTLLFWILATFSTLPQLNGMPTFREKCQQLFKNGESPLALFSYPVLQAADILLYKTTHVPVGDDQTVHVQYARDMALRFNYGYGQLYGTGEEFLPLPEMMSARRLARVRNLRDPTKKMSKSDESSDGKKGRVNLDDSPDLMAEKCKKALTDFTSQITFDPDNRPGVANLINLHSAIVGKTPQEIVEEAKTRNLNTGQYKLQLADDMNAKFQPIRQEFLRLVEERAYLNEILAKNNRKAMETAENCLDEIKRLIGMKF